MAAIVALCLDTVRPLGKELCRREERDLCQALLLPLLATCPYTKSDWWPMCGNLDLVWRSFVVRFKKLSRPLVKAREKITV